MRAAAIDFHELMIADTAKWVRSRSGTALHPCLVGWNCMLYSIDGAASARVVDMLQSSSFLVHLWIYETSDCIAHCSAA